MNQFLELVHEHGFLRFEDHGDWRNLLCNINKRSLLVCRRDLEFYYQMHMVIRVVLDNYESNAVIGCKVACFFLDGILLINIGFSCFIIIIV